MIDRLLTGDLAVPNYLSDGTKGQVDGIRQMFVENLPQMEVLAIDNVAEYFWAGSEQEEWDVRTDFPSVAPPFPLFWMEYRKPSAVNTKREGVRSTRTLPYRSVGILFQSADRGAADPSRRWTLRGDVFLEVEKGATVGPSFVAFFELTADGRVTDFKIGVHHREGGAHPYSDDAIQAGILLYDPCLLALSFLHCKNVRMVDDSVPAELARAYQRRKGRPLIRYHTLEIQPMREVLRREGKSEETGLKRALHICRGHFADYTKGKGLFGRWKGIYWWDAHLRGQISEGAVIKDYAVNKPQGAH